MQFSDTTNKNGIIQTIEYLCGMADGQISGDSTELKRFTGRINAAFDLITPLLLSASTALKFDDLNHSDFPVGTTNLVSGQADYTFSEDDNSLDILRIIAVKILTSSSATQYTDLEIIDGSDAKALDAISPNSLDTGVPSSAYIKGNSVFLNPKPNFSATNGIKIFFEREVSYFASTDTTKEPGIPKPYHELLALHPAHEWVTLFKPEATTMITLLENKIARKEADLKDANTMRHRSSLSMTPIAQDNR